MNAGSTMPLKPVLVPTKNITISEGIKKVESQEPSTPNLIATKPPAILDLKGKIKSLLMSNCTPRQVADSLGCSVSYISDLLKDEDFLNDVLSARVGDAKKATDINTKYSNLEEKLLTKLESAIDSSFGMKPMEVAKILQIVGSKKKEIIPTNPDVPSAGVAVQLNLSPRVSQKFILNDRKDVIGIGNEAFIPMSAAELMREAGTSEGERALNHAHNLRNSANILEQSSDSPEREGAAREKS